MRFRAALSMLVVAGLAVPAAAKDLAASLRGNWSVDKVALFESDAPPFYKMATPEKQKEIRTDMLKDMPDIFVEFTATTMTMKFGAKPPSVATYKVTGTEKSSVSLEVVTQGKPGPADKTSVEFIDGDNVKVVNVGGPTLLMKRVK